MQWFTVFTVVALLHLSSGWFFSSKEPQTWTGLRASFGFNIFNPLTFGWLPRTVEEAEDHGWVADTSVTCSSSSTYRGNRYIKDGDRAAMILFGKNGYVAGIQAGIPKSPNASAFPAPNYYSAFNEEPDMWVVTAYFTEPDTICSTGRTEEQWDRDGTGDMLAFQVGTTPDHLKRIPMRESEVSQTNFKKGKCFRAMGMHYWYRQSADLPCDQIFPAFILYDEGQLAAFGWVFNPDYETSDRWEHPGPNVFGRFMKTPPTCLMNAGHPLTTLHVYMTNTPLGISC